jgi:hypothetical protein
MALSTSVGYRGGVLLQVPRPERFAIHKLIVADRRRTGPDLLKAQKDLLQAAFLIRVLGEDRPDELREAYLSALNRGPQWQKRIQSSLGRLPEAEKTLQHLVHADRQQ